jgi:hypothetical protein
MNAYKATSQDAIVAEDVIRIAALAAAMRVICAGNQIRLQHQSLSVSCPPRPTTEIEFTGRVPFGFAFTEGHEATFHVPSRHRFVIEHVSVSGGAEDDKVEMQMVTRSRHIFRHITLWSGSEQQSTSQSSRTSGAHTVLVQVVP